MIARTVRPAIILQSLIEKLVRFCKICQPGAHDGLAASQCTKTVSCQVGLAYFIQKMRCTSAIMNCDPNADFDIRFLILPIEFRLPHQLEPRSLNADDVLT